MAEEKKEGAAGPGKSRTSLLIAAAIVVLIAAVLGIVVFKFVLQPMLAGDTEQPGQEPPSSFFVDFNDLTVSGQPDNPNEVPPILAFTLTLACRNIETVNVIEASRPRFEGLLVDLYASKTRRQLSDPFEKTQIQQEALRLTNARLKEYQSEVELGVTEVLHRRYTLVEQ